MSSGRLSHARLLLGVTARQAKENRARAGITAYHREAEMFGSRWAIERRFAHFESTDERHISCHGCGRYIGPLQFTAPGSGVVIVTCGRCPKTFYRIGA